MLQYAMLQLLLLTELGWEYLETRRQKLKVEMAYKSF